MALFTGQENVQSEINNFVSAFFGSVTKTDDLVTAGKVNWSLPCGLDTGIVGNPRGAGEGVSCYFLRLFQQQVLVNKGLRGTAGISGINGQPGWTTIAAGFTTPALNQIITIQTVYTPAIRPGMYVFIGTSGWYLVLTTDGQGGITLFAFKLLPGAGAVAPGAPILPVGAPGFGIPGITGPSGIQGPVGFTGILGSQGIPGDTSKINSHVYGAGGTDLTIHDKSGNFTPVDFGFGPFNLILPQPGTYLIAGTIRELWTYGTAIGSDIPGGFVTTEVHPKWKLIDLGNPQAIIPKGVFNEPFQEYYHSHTGVSGTGTPVDFTYHPTQNAVWFSNQSQQTAVFQFSYKTPVATTIQLQAGLGTVIQNPNINFYPDIYLPGMSAAACNMIAVLFSS